MSPVILSHAMSEVEWQANESTNKLILLHPLPGRKGGEGWFIELIGANLGIIVQSHRRGCSTTIELKGRDLTRVEINKIAALSTRCILHNDLTLTPKMLNEAKLCFTKSTSIASISLL